MDLSQTLLQLEQCLLSQAIRCNTKEISRLIADDFIEYGASGNVWTKAEVIEQLPHEQFTHRTISEFAAMQLSEHIALVTYRCETDAQGLRSSSSSLRSSIWREQDEQWQMVFHQGTFVSPAKSKR